MKGRKRRDSTNVTKPSTESDQAQGEEKQWSTGRLKEPISYWHERNWIRWQPEGRVNYVRVARFRAVPQGSATTKGVTEGSETSVVWKARFSRRDGVVEAVEGQKITIARSSDGHRHTQTVPPVPIIGETTFRVRLV